ncbi:MAG: cell division protein FtsL [Gammaproteobacteria bacterium RIFCSPHIGHO2_12_FULL_35_23]|nr:MAG: cell division protein FtsL [Gammaproteobacteria bacterium RIFCSPHIGHO2_12_FULL_35_23]
MNTAVRALTSRSIALWELPFVITREYMMVFSLSFLVLLSAFGLIYLKDVNRRLNNQFEVMQTQNVQLHNEWTQLLLHKTALANQERVAQLAHQELNMSMPASGAVVMIDAK